MPAVVSTIESRKKEYIKRQKKEQSKIPYSALACDIENTSKLLFIYLYSNSYLDEKLMTRCVTKKIEEASHVLGMDKRTIKKSFEELLENSFLYKIETHKDGDILGIRHCGCWGIKFTGSEV